MKKFVSKVLLFSLVLVLLLLSTIYLVKYHSRFKFDDSKNMLIVGNSHTEYAFNDGLVDGLLNLGCAGEPYFYTYFKTRKIIEQNPGIKTVLLEFSNDQIDKVMNDWIWSENAMLNFFPKYGLFMDNEAYNILKKNNPECFRECLGAILKNNFKVLSKGLNYVHHDIGGYSTADINRIDSLLRDLALNKRPVEKNELSPVNIEYTRKLINYLKSRNIKVVLVRAPLHAMYSTYRNEALFQEVLSSQFSDVEFLDFANFPLTNADYGDFGHLNTKGAAIFSSWFNRLVSEGLLSNPDKQAIIKREMFLQSQHLAASN